MISTIKKILSELKNSPELVDKLTEDSNIIEGVGLDSLEMLQFMLEVEEQLQIAIDFETLEYEHLHSIKSLAEFLQGMPAISAVSE